MAIGEEKPGFERKNPAIGEEKPTFEKISSMLTAQNYSRKTNDYILKVYEAIDQNQIFGAPEVKNILGCSTSSSKEIMKKIRNLEIVEPVKGKGKYIFRRYLKDVIKIENEVPTDER
ncbi:MAG: hypothetical protein LUE96_04385 [Lachnospiraceae bacterium]|nr:hypothetical protein [Lachnospiraceae bacterium]